MMLNVKKKKIRLGRSLKVNLFLPQVPGLWDQPPSMAPPGLSVGNGDHSWVQTSDSGSRNTRNHEVSGI